MIDEKVLIEGLKQNGFIIDNEYGNAVINFINNQPKIKETKETFQEETKER